MGFHSHTKLDTFSVVQPARNTHNVLERGGWDVRVRNSSGNYLDEFGDVNQPSQTHGIEAVSK